jgi:carbonic anhydrase
VIIVCGHYGCGGVQASLQNKQFGLIDNWFRHLKDIYSAHRQKLDDLRCCDNGESKASDMMCELNVATSLNNICHTTIVQNAWERGQKLSIHGWVYRLSDGRIRDLDLCISRLDEVEPKIFRVIDSKVSPEK